MIQTARFSLLLGAAVLALAAPALAQTPRESTAFTLASDQPLAPEQAAVSFDHADLSIRVLPEDKAIRGVAVLRFTAQQPVDRLSVELDTRYAVTDVQVDGRTITADGWSNPEGRLTVQLGQTLAAGQTADLRVVWEGQPRVAPNAPWDGGFVWSTTADGKPWIASAVQGEGCDLIFPCIDTSLREPGRVDLHVTVPEGLVAPGNGTFQGHIDNGDGTTTWSWSAKRPNIYAVNITVGPYVEKTAEYRSRFGNVIPMHFWHLAGDDPAKVDRLFAEIPQMLDFFESTVGPYPFGDEKVGVVETPHLGMEHQTINAYGNGFKVDERGYDWLIQHEFAHEWFANQLTNVNADDMWLHEGIGSYMQPLYARWLRGDRYMQRELADQRDELLNLAPLVSRRPMAVEEVYEAPGPAGDIYYKGSLVIHTLRMTLGDDDFYRAIRRLIYGRDDPRPGNFEPVLRSTADFNAIVNDVSGRNYDWFFDAYVYEARLPRLAVLRENGRLMLEWYSPVGAFPMPVEVEVDGRLETVPMRDGRGSIRVPDGASVLVDPHNKILRQDDAVDAYRTSGG